MVTGTKGRVQKVHKGSGEETRLAIARRRLSRLKAQGKEQCVEDTRVKNPVPNCGGDAHARQKERKKEKREETKKNKMISTNKTMTACRQR
jgi:hypothetical protein